jgi:hypothetical protein
MRGKIGLGFLVFALWSTSAAAEESGSFVQAKSDGGSSGAVRVADGEQRTALVGFQAVDHEARLEQNALPDGTSEDWSIVCDAPCTRRLPRDATFRAAGDNFEASRPFRIPENRERVIVTSQLGEPQSRAVPILMTVLGWTSFGLIGPLLFVGGAVNGNDPMAMSGAILTIGGAVAGTAGIILLATGPRGRRSHVTIARGGAPRLELGRGIGLDAHGLTF